MTLKRAFDIFFCLAALPLALPLMGLSVLMVYLEDGSPVLFRQKRIGRNGCVFEMFKIRTMAKNAGELQGRKDEATSASDSIYAGKDDPRITRVGRLLRRFSLDELPQLFNVLAGTMSLVGPRPELPQLAEKYETWQRARFSVLPGITGWWQINHRSHQPMSLHIEDDLYYIQNYSFWLDLQIILRTTWVVFIGKDAY